MPLADLCGGLREEMLAPARKDICGNYDLWDFVEHACHLPPYGQGFQPFLAVQYQDYRSCVSGEGRPRMPMGIRGALVPVVFFDPSLRDSRSQLARLEIHSPETFVAANVSHPEKAGWYHHS